MFFERAANFADAEIRKGRKADGSQTEMNQKESKGMNTEG